MKSLHAYRKSSDLPLHRRVKGVAGNVLMALRPEMAAAVKAAPFREDWPTAGKLIRNGHLFNAVSVRNHPLICISYPTSGLPTPRMNFTPVFPTATKRCF